MKKIVVFCLLMLFSTSPAVASKMNLDPYFSVGTSSMVADIGGNQSTAPCFYFAAGSTLNWISPELGAEFRFGFGGQFNTFDGEINNYTSLLLKPGFELSRSLDIYGLVGATTMSVTIANQTYTDTGLSYGAGLAYHIPDESLILSGELMSYHTSSSQSTTSISGMDIIGASIAITFEYY